LRYESAVASGVHNIEYPSDMGDVIREEENEDSEKGLTTKGFSSGKKEKKFGGKRAASTDSMKNFISKSMSQ